MEGASIYWKQQGEKKGSLIRLRSCLNFWVQHLKCFETLILFIAFYKPVPPLHFSAKSCAENPRLPGSARWGTCALASFTLGTAGSRRGLQFSARLPGLQAWPLSPWLQAVRLFRFSGKGAKAILVHPDHLNAARGGPPLGAVACLLASEVILASL